MKPEDLTAQWLGDALSTEVESAETTEIVWGTGTKVLMRLTYGEDTDLPTEICVKGGFDESIQGFGVEDCYGIEADFYGNVAPLLETPLARCLYAGQEIVILEDLKAAGASFGDPLEPWDTDRVAAGLEAQAAWHRPTWEADDGPVGALSVGATAVRAAAEALLSEPHWEGTFGAEGAPSIPPEIDDRERILAGFRRLWERDEAGPLALAHGDAHIGNTYIDTDGRPAFLDWQGTCRAPALYDVAYFVGGAMTPEDRRAAERDLLRHYLDALAAGDGPRLDFDSAWEDFRRYTLHGFLWVVTPPVMQPIERVRAMGERHATAIAEHESLAALGV